jgi:arylsulfatase A-like enzyme
VDDRKLTELSDEDICNLRATYYGLISEVDSQIGRLIEHLKQCGLYEKTLIVLTSDHGEQLGDHYLFGKQCHFEESYHIPLIIKGAGDEFRRGETLARFTESVDIMPTVLESCGLPVPHQCDGRSLLPFLRGETLDDWRNEVCGLYDFRNVRGKNAEKRFGLRSDQCALMFIRDERYKYIHYTALAPALYEFEQDPGELNNLASDPAFRQVMLEYAQRLLSWRMRNEYGALDLMVAAEGGIHVGEG